jgi:hypothetical protein
VHPARVALTLTRAPRRAAQVIKALNAGKAGREETVERARRIFGPDNGDLDAGFQALLSRHLKPA